MHHSIYVNTLQGSYHYTNFPPLNKLLVNTYEFQNLQFISCEGQYGDATNNWAWRVTKMLDAQIACV